MKTPLLKYHGCHRGTANVRNFRETVTHKIRSGPLKGCVCMPSGKTALIGRGYVLLFKPVIRVGAL